MPSLDKVIENNILLGRLLRQSQADRARKNERRMVDPHPPASGSCIHCGTYHTLSQHWSHAHAGAEAGACSYLRPCGPATTTRAKRAPAPPPNASPPLGEFPPWERATPASRTRKTKKPAPKKKAAPPPKKDPAKKRATTPKKAAAAATRAPATAQTMPVPRAARRAPTKKATATPAPNSRTQKVAPSSPKKKACKPGCACCPSKATPKKNAPKKTAAAKAPGPRKAATAAARSSSPKKTAKKASPNKPRKAASRPPVSAAAAGAQDPGRGEEVRVWDGGPLERGVTYTTAEGKRAFDDKRRAEVRWSRAGAGAHSGVRASAERWPMLLFVAHNRTATGHWALEVGRGGLPDTLLSARLENLGAAKKAAADYARKH